MKNKLMNKVRMLLLAALVLALTIPAVALADAEDRAEMRDHYGLDSVVTDDDVERVLRQNGVWVDD